MPKDFNISFSDDEALDYIRKLENPHKVGWDGKVWRTPKQKGFDHNQIAYGLDIRKENNPLVYNFLKDKGRLNDPWLTDAEAKHLMAKTFEQKKDSIGKAIAIANGNVSLMGYNRLAGMAWHGDPMKRILDKNSVTGKAYRDEVAHGNTEFTGTFDTYYNYGSNKTRFADRAALDYTFRPQYVKDDRGTRLIVNPAVYLKEQFQPSFEHKLPAKTVYPLNNKVPTSVSSWSGANAPNATPRMPSLQENLGRNLKDMWDLFDRNAVAYGRDRTALNLDLPPLEDLMLLNSPEEQLKRWVALTLEVPQIQLDMPMLLPLGRFKCGKLPRYADGTDGMLTSPYVDRRSDIINPQGDGRIPYGAGLGPAGDSPLVMLDLIGSMGPYGNDPDIITGVAPIVGRGGMTWKLRSDALLKHMKPRARARYLLEIESQRAPRLNYMDAIGESQNQIPQTKPTTPRTYENHIKPDGTPYTQEELNGLGIDQERHIITDRGGRANVPNTNPGGKKRYKYGKRPILPRFEDGIPPIRNGLRADATWHRNWLNGRRQQFQENLNSADLYDREFVYPDHNTSTIEGQVRNLENSRIYTNPQLMDRVMGVEPGSTQSFGEYNGFTHQNSLSPEGGSNIYISPKGGRTNTSIRGPKVYFSPENLYIHEGTHALVEPSYGKTKPIEPRSPQESKIQSINEEAGKHLYSDRYNPNEPIVAGDYYDRPTETYAELMRSRYELGLTPDHIVTLKELKEWRKSGKLPYGLARYSDDVLLRYYNEVASNPNPLFDSNNVLYTYGPNDGLIIYAANGKSPIHIKKENRGKFTALKKRTGHSASWFKAHGTPALKKMAVFELNARKWRR